MRNVSINRLHSLPQLAVCFHRDEPDGNGINLCEYSHTNKANKNNYIFAIKKKAEEEIKS